VITRAGNSILKKAAEIIGVVEQRGSRPSNVYGEQVRVLESDGHDK
jgi:hypothetical protein